MLHRYRRHNSPIILAGFACSAASPRPTYQLRAVEPSFLEATLLLGRDLDIVWRHQENLLRHLVHGPPQGVGDATAKIDHAVGELTVRIAEVDYDGLASAEPVRDLLSVGELNRRSHVHSGRRCRGR